MDLQLLIICGLTFVIHLIATLAYAVRIAGVRTRRIAVSFSLFGIVALISRTANSFQGPFIAKRVELDIAHHTAHGLLGDFRLSCYPLRWQALPARFSFPRSNVTSAALSTTSRQIDQSPVCCFMFSVAGVSATFGSERGSRPGITLLSWQLVQAFRGKS